MKYIFIYLYIKNIQTIKIYIIIQKTNPIYLYIIYSYIKNIQTIKNI